MAAGRDDVGALVQGAIVAAGDRSDAPVADPNEVGACVSGAAHAVSTATDRPIVNGTTRVTHLATEDVMPPG